MFSDDGTRLKFEASWDVVFWDHAVRREAKLMHCPDCDGNGTGPKQVDHHQDATTHREARRHEYNPEAILQFGNRYRGAWKDCVGSTVGGGEGVSFEPEPVHGGTLQKFLRYWMMSRLWGLRWPKRGNLQTPGRKRENTPAKSLESQPMNETTTTVFRYLYPTHHHVSMSLSYTCSPRLSRTDRGSVMALVVLAYLTGR